jgi:hypothetical protein
MTKVKHSKGEFMESPWTLISRLGGWVALFLAVFQLDSALAEQPFQDKSSRSSRSPLAWANVTPTVEQGSSALTKLPNPPAESASSRRSGLPWPTEGANRTWQQGDGGVAQPQPLSAIPWLQLENQQSSSTAQPSHQYNAWPALEKPELFNPSRSNATAQEEFNWIPRLAPDRSQATGDQPSNFWPTLPLGRANTTPSTTTPSATNDSGIADSTPFWQPATRDAVEPVRIDNTPTGMLQLPATQLPASQPEAAEPNWDTRLELSDEVSSSRKTRPHLESPSDSAAIDVDLPTATSLDRPSEEPAPTYLLAPISIAENLGDSAAAKFDDQGHRPDHYFVQQPSVDGNFEGEFIGKIDVGLIERVEPEQSLSSPIDVLPIARAISSDTSIPPNATFQTSKYIGPMAPPEILFSDLQISAPFQELGQQPAADIRTSQGEDSIEYTWMPEVFTWASPSFFHRPLYFEQVNLERYGIGPKRSLQPVCSSMHFFGSLALMPYKVLTQHPQERVYSLGHQRPGNRVAYQGRPFLGQSTVGEACKYYEDYSGYK